MLEHCPTHPKYRALRKPTADCAECRIQYLQLHDPKFMSDYLNKMISTIVPLKLIDFVKIEPADERKVRIRVHFSSEDWTEDILSPAHARTFIVGILSGLDLAEIK